MAARSAIRVGFAAIFLALCACDPLGTGKPRDRYYVTVQLQAHQYANDLRILLVRAGTADTLDTVWTGKAQDSSDLERLPTRRYRGGPVDVVVWGLENGIFQWYELLKFRLPGERPIRELHWRKEYLPFLNLPPGSGQDVQFLAQGEPVAIDTPTCADRKHEPLVVETRGSVDTGTPGDYSIRYTCQDKDGFQAEGFRNYRVISKDSLSPKLEFLGKDTIRLFVGDHVRASAVTCLDYKLHPLQVTAEGRVDTAHLGYYRVRYACQDAANRRADTSRFFAVISPKNRFAVFRATQETGIDIFGPSNMNIGYNGFLHLSRSTPERYFSFFQFDMAQAKASPPIAARIRLKIYGYGSLYADSVLQCRFYIQALRLAWKEGHGNYYYNRGQWANFGEKIFANYPLSDSIRQASAPPLPPDGTGLLEHDLVSEENLALVDSLDIDLPMTSKHGLIAIPKPEDLITLELDVSDYVRTVDPQSDHGFLISVLGVPDAHNLAFLTKEAGDGSFGPELVVEY